MAFIQVPTIDEFQIKPKLIFNFDETMISFVKDKRLQVKRSNGTLTPIEENTIPKHLTLVLKNLCSCISF